MVIWFFYSVRDRNNRWEGDPRRSPWKSTFRTPADLALVWLWKLLRATIRVVCSGSAEFPQSLNIQGLSYSPCEDSIGLTPRCSFRSLGQEHSQINFETSKACSTCQGRHLTDGSGCRSAGRRLAWSRDGASSRKKFIRVPRRASLG